MIFLDSNILAYAFYDNEYRDTCQNFIRKGGVINTLNLVEAFNVIEHETTRGFATKSIRSLLRSNLRIIEIDINIVFEALKKTDSKLKFIDLIHYISAIATGCEQIASFDKDFDNLDIERINSFSS